MTVIDRSRLRSLPRSTAGFGTAVGVPAPDVAPPTTSRSPEVARPPSVFNPPPSSVARPPSVFNPPPSSIERSGADPFVTPTEPGLTDFLDEQTRSGPGGFDPGEFTARGLPEPETTTTATAAGALGGFAGTAPASPVPAAVGGGTAGFATGNNCEGCAATGGPVTAPQDGLTPPGAGGGPISPYLPGASELERIQALDNDVEFQAELDRITSTYGITREQVYGIIAGESSYRADLFSPGGGYGGLFQLGVGTMGLDDRYTSAAVASLSPAEQIRLYGSVLDYHAGRGWTASQGLGILQGAPALSGWAANRDLGEWVSPSGDRPYAIGGRYWEANPTWRGADGRITPNSMNTYYSRRNPPPSS